MLSVTRDDSVLRRSATSYSNSNLIGIKFYIDRKRSRYVYIGTKKLRNRLYNNDYERVKYKE